jgi:uncharacterized membrane protein
MEPNTQNQSNTSSNEPMRQETVAPVSSAAPSNDGVSEHKLWAIVGYILPILFFIPMLDEKSKHNAFARFHAEQQLALLAVSIGVYVAANILIGMFMGGLYFIFNIIQLAMLVLVVLGVINAAQGQMKALPVIGGIKLLDKVFKD